ncbi:hypothetical protein ACHAWT_010481 [Skeletonema menzelii]
MSLPPHALEIDPESSLQFTITRGPAKDGSDDVSRCTMTLRHPGHTNKYLAFKVKTTQPRRYLVRPNQGIVAPNSSETVTIILVGKDREVLWSSYERLGQSALDHSKDKFLVQSCEVSNEFSAKFNNEPRLGEGGQYKKELVEELTAMWNSASSNSKLEVYNKKLHVRHVADTGATTAGGAAAGGAPGSANTSLPTSFQEGVDKRNNADKMSPEQLSDEVSNLRRKYDELVAFSVNLTAERDILNNTLEQTKRDLNREMATRTALEKQGLKVGSRSHDAKSSKSSGGVSAKTLLIVVVVACLSAIRATNLGSLDMLGSVPMFGGMLGFDSSAKKMVRDEL